jgi:hypothetical protein
MISVIALHHDLTGEGADARGGKARGQQRERERKRRPVAGQFLELGLLGAGPVVGGHAPSPPDSTNVLPGPTWWAGAVAGR